MSVSLEFPNLSAAIHDVRGLGRTGRMAQKKALEAGGAVLREAVRQQLSITTYSLAALARKGHPYADRHGSIKIHQQRPFMVHKQGGAMVKSTTLEVKGYPGGSGGGAKYGARVGLDYGKQRYFKYVIEGTKIMLPRDTLYQTSQLPEVRTGMMQAVVKVMGAELRTQSTIRLT